MFGGFGGEILYRPYSSIFALGADVYWVKKREFNQLFSFRNYETTTGHITLYLTEPKTNILFKLYGGRYLAEDSGVTLDISRTYRSGLRLGIFASKTDISSQEFGEGTFDKGFYINFPIDAFFRNYRRGLTSFGLRPITRDGAARLLVGHDLYGVTDQGSINNFYFNFEDIYD